MSPRGYSVKPVELSEDLQAEHHLESVRVYGLVQRGDGWVLNEWPNRQLSGSVAQLHARNTELGRKRYYDFPTIDSALLEVDAVYDSAMSEAARIAGPVSGPTPRDQGELAELRDRRVQLGHWLTLSQVEKEEIESFFGRVSGKRERAINPLNIAIAVKAARMQELQKEKRPGAVLAMTHPLEHTFEERYTEIIRDVLGVASARKRRLLLLAFEESRTLAAANNVLDRIITQQDEDAFYTLKLITPHIKFRHEPFNLLAYTLRKSRGRIQDVEDIEITQRGLRFERQRNYYLETFRKLGALGIEGLEETLGTVVEEFVPDIEQRIEGLESANIGGQYSRHTDQLTRLALGIRTALYQRNPSLVQARVRAFKMRIERHGDPAKPRELEPWFRYQLATQSRR